MGREAGKGLSWSDYVHQNDEAGSSAGRVALPLNAVGLLGRLGLTC